MISALAKMLGLSRDDAEASMHNERAARAVLTRRNLFAAAGAMAAGSAFSFGAPNVPSIGLIHEVRLSLTQAAAGYTFPVPGRILGHWLDPSRYEFVVWFQEQPIDVDVCVMG